MVFTAEPMQPKPVVKRKLKADYPFDAMRDKINTGFIVPAERLDLHSNVRVMASLYNKKHGTKITCNKQDDGSMRVWHGDVIKALPTIQDDEHARTEQFNKDLAVSEAISEHEIVAPAAKYERPNKAEFVGYLQTVLPGVSIKLGKEFVHRFTEFEIWTLELDGFDTAITYNPPELKITRKGK
jgi:hypothetical protein